MITSSTGDKDERDKVIVEDNKMKQLHRIDNNLFNVSFKLIGFNGYYVKDEDQLKDDVLL